MCWTMPSFCLFVCPLPSCHPDSRIDAKAALAADCEGQAFCEDGMTLTVQGGYCIMAAYSDEPGNLSKAPQGDLCQALELMNPFNNLFCDASSSGEADNLDELYKQLRIPPKQHKSAPHSKGTDKSGIRRHLMQEPRAIYPTSFLFANLNVFDNVNKTGYYDYALKVRGCVGGHGASEDTA